MDLLSSLNMAWRSILVNKLRSALTMLGVIIGVAAVIIMVALSQGTATGITERISSMGANLLTISAGGGNGPIRGLSTAQLSTSDVEAIKNLPLVKRVAPEVSINGATVSAGSLTWTTTVNGTTPELQEIKNWPTVMGGFFTDDDCSRVSRAAVLGQTVASNLFPDTPLPLGRTLRINGLDFTVIGVLEQKGGGGSFMDQDNIIYIPITTAQQRILGSSGVRSINVQATSAEALPTLKNYITTLLRQRHRLADSADDDFRIQDMSEILATVEDTTKMLTFLLGGIAAVSLLVGGIGIMNIMLVSVTERTREIGLRQAVGATPADIEVQFLTEALMLSLFGGLIGVLMGVGGSELFGKLSGMRTVIVPYSIVLSFTSAALIGVFFGFIPARKAAQLDPIVALRHE